MRSQPHYAAVPFDLLDPRTLLKEQRDLINGEISDGERYVLAFGPDPADPAFYIHISSGMVLKLSASRLVETIYRGLAAEHGELMTAFEAVGTDDPRLAGIELGDDRHYINSLYHAVIRPGPDGHTGILLCRVDKSPIVNLKHCEQIIADLLPDHTGTSVIPVAISSGGWYAIACDAAPAVTYQQPNAGGPVAVPNFDPETTDG